MIYNDDKIKKRERKKGFKKPVEKERNKERKVFEPRMRNQYHQNWLKDKV